MGVGGKRESKKESKRKKKETHPAQWDGLEGIDNRVGSWGKKNQIKESKKESKRAKEQKRKCDCKSKETKESPVTFKSQTDLHID